MMNYKMIDFDSEEMFTAIHDFFEMVKRDRVELDMILSGKTMEERIELYKNFYKKQERYANDLFNDISEDDREG